MKWSGVVNTVLYNRDVYSLENQKKERGADNVSAGCTTAELQVAITNLFLVPVLEDKRHKSNHLVPQPLHTRRPQT